MLVINTNSKGLEIRSDSKNIYVYCQSYDEARIRTAIAKHFWELLKTATKDPEHFGHLIGRIKRI